MIQSSYVCFSVGRSAQARNFSPRRLCSTSEQPCGYCGPAHSAMAGDPTPCSTDRRWAPRGTAERRGRWLRLSKAGTIAGQQVWEQTHHPAADHHTAEEAVEGAARANCTAEGEAEHDGLGAGNGENRTAHPAVNAKRLKTKEPQLWPHRAEVGSLSQNVRHPSLRSQNSKCLRFQHEKWMKQLIDYQNSWSYLKCSC